MRRRSIVFLFVVITILFYANFLHNFWFMGKHSRAVYRTPTFSYLPNRRSNGINCAAIIANDTEEINKAKTMMRSNSIKQQMISDKDYITLTKDCENFKSVRGYLSNSHVTQEERDFPVAFSILLYKDVEQAERLLRVIYRPQNVYCMHVDADSNPDVHAAVDHIADCFPNVFVVSRKEYIVYAGFSRLQADLNCMADLLRSSIHWKYFINLPSQQFPIKTNAEIVKTLKIYNGSNDIISNLSNRKLRERLHYRRFYHYSDINSKATILKSKERKGNPPFNITIFKGNAYNVFCRDMVRFICENKIARALLDYLRDVYSPDEYYWATLNQNPHIQAPGSHRDTSKKLSTLKVRSLAVYIKWTKHVNMECHGKSVRGICVYGVGDLHSLVRKEHLFVNKFYYNFEPLALTCMEEWYFNKTLNDFNS